MPVATFTADAVFIPDNGSAPVLLMVIGDNNSADVFTEDGEPFCHREWGEFTAVDGGKVELLPELWIVKIDERDYWIDPDVLANCPRIYGVYVFDRRQHVHICSVEPCYELHFLGSQYDEAEELLDDEYRRDQINGKILDGDAQCDLVSYWSKADIDRMLDCEIAEGCLPPEGMHGGYPLRGIVSVTPEDAIEEAREANSESPL